MSGLRPGLVPEGEGAYVAWLDSVRGLAALTVIGSHYVNSYDLPCRDAVCNRLLSNTPLHVWWDGGAAVSLFFVLSGLVLSLRHFRAGVLQDFSHFRLGRYVVGRLCRLWPPYLVALAVSVPLYHHYQAVSAHLPATVPPQNDWLPHMWGRPAGWADVFKDSFLLGMRMEMVYVPQAWTLSIELALSLLVPVGVMLALRHSAWLVGFTLFAIYPLGVSANLFHFMLGILIAKHHGQIGPCLQARAACRRVVLVLGVFLYTIEETLGDAVKRLLAEPAASNCLGWLAASGAALLLLYAWASSRARRVLSLSWFRYLGRISYSIYLVHFAVLINATPWLLSLLDATADGFVLAWWAGLAATVGLSVLLAAFSYRFVEVPSIALGRRLSAFAAAA